MTIVVNLFGLNALGERFLNFAISELWDGNIAFEITAPPKINFEQGTLELQVVEVESGDFDFDAVTEEGTPPSVPGDTEIAATVEIPANITLSEYQISANGANGVGVKAVWDEPARAGLLFEANIREGTGEWQQMNVIADPDADIYSAFSNIVSTGDEHGVRVRAFTQSGRASDWSTEVKITPVADDIIPSTPTDFTATGKAGEADISWRNPSETSLDHVKLYRHTSDDFSGAAQIGGNVVGGLGAIINMTDESLAADTYYYWLKSFNSAGDGSAVTSAQSAVVT